MVRSILAIMLLLSCIVNDVQADVISPNNVAQLYGTDAPFVGKNYKIGDVDIVDEFGFLSPLSGLVAEAQDIHKRFVADPLKIQSVYGMSAITAYANRFFLNASGDILPRRKADIVEFMLGSTGQLGIFIHGVLSMNVDAAIARVDLKRLLKPYALKKLQGITNDKIAEWFTGGIANIAAKDKQKLVGKPTPEEFFAAYLKTLEVNAKPVWQQGSERIYSLFTTELPAQIALINNDRQRLLAGQGAYRDFMQARLSIIEKGIGLKDKELITKLQSFAEAFRKACVQEKMLFGSCDTTLLLTSIYQASFLQELQESNDFKKAIDDYITPFLTKGAALPDHQLSRAGLLAVMQKADKAAGSQHELLLATLAEAALRPRVFPSVINRRGIEPERYQCVEKATESFISLLLFDAKKQEFDISRLKASAPQEIRSFFEAINKLKLDKKGLLTEAASDSTVTQRAVALMMNKKSHGVEYSPKSGTEQYNARGSASNYFNLLSYLLGDKPIYEHEVLVDEDVERVRKNMQTILGLVKGHGLTLESVIIERPEKEDGSDPAAKIELATEIILKLGAANDKVKIKISGRHVEVTFIAHNESQECQKAFQSNPLLALSHYCPKPMAFSNQVLQVGMWGLGLETSEQRLRFAVAFSKRKEASLLKAYQQIALSLYANYENAEGLLARIGAIDWLPAPITDKERDVVAHTLDSLMLDVLWNSQAAEKIVRLYQKFGLVPGEYFFHLEDGKAVFAAGVQEMASLKYGIKGVETFITTVYGLGPTIKFGKAAPDVISALFHVGSIKGIEIIAKHEPLTAMAIIESWSGDKKMTLQEAQRIKALFSLPAVTTEFKEDLVLCLLISNYADADKHAIVKIFAPELERYLATAFKRRKKDLEASPYRWPILYLTIDEYIRAIGVDKLSPDFIAFLKAQDALNIEHAEDKKSAHYVQEKLYRALGGPQSAH